MEEVQRRVLTDQMPFGTQSCGQVAHLVEAVVGRGSGERLAVHQREDAAMEEVGDYRIGGGDEGRKLLRAGLDPVFVRPPVAVADADDAAPGLGRPRAHALLEPLGEVVAIDGDVGGAVIDRLVIDRVGELQHRIEHQRRVEFERIGNDPARIGVAHGDVVEGLELLDPGRFESAGRGMVAEARRIGGAAAGLEPVAIKDRLPAIPGMSQVPHLVAAHQHQIDRIGGLRRVEAERARQRQLLEGGEELAGLAGIEFAILPLAPRAGHRPQGAAPFLPVDGVGLVVEQHGIEAAPPQTFGEAARLPVGAIVDAAVKGEDADLCHERGYRA